MYGATRSVVTLIGVAAAAVLLWLGVQIVDPFDEGDALTNGEYWAWMATLAGAGFVIALSQLLGGWTKWGWPRLSVPVFLLAFVPALLAGLWAIGVHQPGDNWLSDNAREWADDVDAGRLFSELGVVVPVIAFALGLLFGLTFDTSGRVREVGVVEERDVVRAPPAAAQPRRVERDDDAARADTVVAPPPGSDAGARTVVAEPERPPDRSSDEGGTTVAHGPGREADDPERTVVRGPDQRPETHPGDAPRRVE